MNASVSQASKPPPLTVTVRDACQLLGLGNTSIWKLIGEGRLNTVKIGKRRLIVYASIEELIASALAVTSALDRVLEARRGMTSRK